MERHVPSRRPLWAATLLLAALTLVAPPALALAPACPSDNASLTTNELLADPPGHDTPVVLEGIVTGVFMGNDQLGGFYLQNDESDRATGLFVYAPGQEPVTPGDRLRVQGRFGHHHGRPQLARVDGIKTCGSGRLPEPVTLELPRDAQRLSDFEDVRVRFEQTLTVTGHHELERYGSLTLSAGGRLWHPGQTGEFDDHDHAERRIVLDDGSYRARPDPVPYLDDQGTRRVGSQVTGLTGILTHAFDAHRLHPTQSPQWEGGARPEAPERAADGALRIATANLENDFVTLGERGASSRAERVRQEAKLNTALRPLKADVITTIELENRPAARERLIERLNQHGDITYQAVRHPAPGTDAIKVGMSYRPDRLELLDAVADGDRVHHRPPLLAWFGTLDGEPLFGIVAVHFKAKSGCPSSGDIDRGQGCWNERRTAQAERLAQWIEQERRDGLPVIIAGDLNAYAAEDPLRLLREAGKRDLVHAEPDQAYSYVFRGQSGQLDYLLGPRDLEERVGKAGSWAINADEPAFLGFDGSQPAEGPWRASDHDPVWLDLQRD
ncbi:Endonuclease/exonuclease/phosphatase [Thioalkalivibrio sp. K90mix]|uniref:ExeM/NucH family extracellular endonuclease n=1 Tax=Thioalkalivibrio sp. (strain K90mix) TaxID=396595 RepID=UPI000195A5E5|nr:ExeM/NucH family extracellular endonuclease [Thioalkalivibrio sp. K90mix]ADC71575.1 Endonuclease/exonuclease/phosphatase [Thioalkalivibrio sp. K90mix]